MPTWTSGRGAIELRHHTLRPEAVAFRPLLIDRSLLTKPCRVVSLSQPRWAESRSIRRPV